MAARVAGARMLELPGEFYVSGEVGRDDDVLDAIAEFLTGEIERRADDVAGIAVHIGSWIGAMAAAG